MKKRMIDPRRILLVGDGDFSGSLAILRAYCHWHQQKAIERLVTTTLLSSEEELIKMYPHAKLILQEFSNFHSPQQPSTVVTILFAVDATQIHQNKDVRRLRPYDYIMFHHPHLGYGDNTGRNSKNNNNSQLAMRHSCLLAHYLYSVKQLLVQLLKDEEEKTMMTANSYGIVHLCLCAGQSKKWKLKSIVHRLELEYVCPPRFASLPLWPHLTAAVSEEIATATQQQPQPQYWLSQYGYQHQVTHPATTRLNSAVNSHDHFLRIRRDAKNNPLLSDEVGKELALTSQDAMVSCKICQEKLCNAAALVMHLSAPAIPVVPERAISVELGQPKHGHRYRSQS